MKPSSCRKELNMLPKSSLENSRETFFGKVSTNASVILLPCMRDWMTNSTPPISNWKGKK
jgi:hypothetical protein